MVAHASNLTRGTRDKSSQLQGAGDESRLYETHKQKHGLKKKTSDKCLHILSLTLSLKPFPRITQFVPFPLGSISHQHTHCSQDNKYQE